MAGIVPVRGLLILSCMENKVYKLTHFSFMIALLILLSKIDLHHRQCVHSVMTGKKEIISVLY